MSEDLSKIEPHQTCYNCGGKGAHNEGCPALASPSPASDAELPPLPKAAAWQHTMDNTEGIRGNEPHVVLSFGKRNPFGRAGVDYSTSFPVTAEPLFTADQMRDYARAASTRTASDTRTAAGEAECDAARRAAPASQQDAGVAVGVAEPMAGSAGGFTMCVFNAYDVPAGTKLYASSVPRELSDHEIVAVLASLGTDADKSIYPDNPVLQVRTTVPGIRQIVAAYIKAAAQGDESAAAGPACQGGNTKQDALQELTSIAQANNMGYGPPAVDVEAERQAAITAYAFIGGNDDSGFSAFFNGWLAACKEDAEQSITTKPENT